MCPDFSTCLPLLKHKQMDAPMGLGSEISPYKRNFCCFQAPFVEWFFVNETLQTGLTLRVMSKPAHLAVDVRFVLQ